MSDRSDPPIYVWVAVGEKSTPPGRIRVEACADCGGWVPTDTFDQHGKFHRDLERAGVAAAR